MKLSVSNIAWSPDEAEAAYALLERHGIRGLEIAPSLLLAGEDDPCAATPDVLSAALQAAKRHALTLTSMQSLLFGVHGAALFGSPVERDRLSVAMARVTALAGRLGIRNLVFGAPKNRVIPEGWSNEDARAVWLPAFQLTLPVLVTSVPTVSAGSMVARKRNTAVPPTARSPSLEL